MTSTRSVGENFDEQPDSPVAKDRLRVPAHSRRNGRRRHIRLLNGPLVGCSSSPASLRQSELHRFVAVACAFFAWTTTHGPP